MHCCLSIEVPLFKKAASGVSSASILETTPERKINYKLQTVSISEHNLLTIRRTNLAPLLGMHYGLGRQASSFEASSYSPDSFVHQAAWSRRKNPKRVYQFSPCLSFASLHIIAGSLFLCTLLCILCANQWIRLIISDHRLYFRSRSFPPGG